jgi:hypothetical protein
MGTRSLSAVIADHRKEKSLGLLTQNFVKLFLTMEVSGTEYLPVYLGCYSSLALTVMGFVTGAG